MRTTLLLLGTLAISLAGCRSDKAARVDSAGEPATLTSARGPESPTLKARMHDHDAHGAAMRDAVARADLDATWREAKSLAELRIDGGIEPTWRKNLDAMNAAAARVAEAKDVAEASRGLAGVARTCGNCHTTLGGPGPVVGEAPHESVEVVPRMQRHQWAAARLWDGLVVPSEDAWKAGARVLADAPLEPELLTPGKSPVPAIGTLARSVQELARKASVAEALDRDAIYGELVSTCSACHLRLGGGPPEMRRK
jgi:mono/diheme cytochrome c family protein